MRDVGATAPAFELPGVVRGDRKPVGLKEHLGRSIVILAFYPGAFNPGCDKRSTVLEKLEVFAIQSGVEVLAISGDSVHSNAAFAEQYDLSLPLLSDLHGDVTAEYGVAATDPTAGYRTQRAVFVVEPQGDIVFRWVGEKPTDAPPVEKLRSVVESAGGDAAAAERYRLGHACFTEGRRALQAGRRAYVNEAWEHARSRFAAAGDTLAVATEHLNIAVRFAHDEAASETLRAAQTLGNALETATSWLGDAAAARAAGKVVATKSTRRNAEQLLRSTASVELPDPTTFPPSSPPEALLQAADSAVEQMADGSDRDLDVTVPLTDEIEPSYVFGGSVDETTINEAELAEIRAAVARQSGED
ncbi:MAG: redoxin domain-containing protein [Salinirussus sp.]